MSAVSWLALGAALLCVPAGSAVRRRVDVLVGAGRLSGVAERSRWRVSTRLVAAAIAGGAVVAVVVAGPVLGFGLLAAGAAVGMVIRDARTRRRAARRRRSALGGVRLLVAELAAGGRPSSALAAAARAAPEHDVVFRNASRAAAEGGDVGGELNGSAELRGVGAAWRVADASGAPLADVLDRLAADLAGAASQERAVMTALAGPRSTAGLLAALPVVGLLLGVTMGADPLSMLLGSSAGRAVCCVGLLLDAAGLLWTHRLLRSAEGP